MRFLVLLITLSGLAFFSCEPEERIIYPEEIIISCQEDADAAKTLIGDAIFDVDNPEEGFKGDIIINTAASCGSPITDLSLFANYKFWLGRITIESDDISDLSFLDPVEQIRGGLIIRNCANLDSLFLPKVAFIGQIFEVVENPVLKSIQIGSDIFEDYETIEFDSTIIMSNPELIAWKPGKEKIDFLKSTEILGNEKLTSLEAFSDLSMPFQSFILQMFGTTINNDGINNVVDSLTMPKRTLITATLPNNDYSWLNKAKERFRFEMDSVLIDSIVSFQLQGEIEIEEVCQFKDVINNTPLTIISTASGTTVSITSENLSDECP